MVVCGKFEEDYLTFPPIMILEISSSSTYLKNRNTKLNLYEICGVKYYIIADVQKKLVEVFELMDNKYQQTTTTNFILNAACSLDVNMYNFWDD